MKNILLALCGCFLLGVVVIASPVSNEGHQKQHLLGETKCTWGPSFWCSNITNAKSCHAVTHCIHTVWEKHTVPEDTDSICKICLDMVQQARDQLESNETQADLKAVFEGSCNLIPLKPIKKECIRLADDFVPELVEALSSQMNPQSVCSVAGLCNNAAIDKMLADQPLLLPMAQPQKQQNIQMQDPSTTNNGKELSCGQCNKIGGIISRKFHSQNRDEILENMLYGCGKLSSFSDACANIILIYFNEIYQHFAENLNSNVLCHMAGVCTEQYHQHVEEFVEIRPMSNVGFVDVKDDIPCELCQQLVKHLKDVLVANTTEDEFKTVLKGFCGQTKTFKDECNSIVDQYYGVIYNTLITDLNENEACMLIQICPRGLKDSNQQAPIMPIVPMKTFEQAHISITPKPKKFILGANEPKLTNEQIQNIQLPIDNLMLLPPNHQLLVDDGKWCTICEYFLHFVQEAIASPKTEENIKRAVAETCNKLPKQVGPECHSFVDNYGDAIIALLVEGIDPSQVCPKLFICPQNKKDYEVFAPKTITVKTASDQMDVTIKTKNSGTDKCPMCLLAVQAVIDTIQTDKSKQKIMETLDGLCRHFPNKLQDECTDFIDTYTSELVRMLANDFSAQDICVNLKLCSGKPEQIDVHSEANGDILTNEIPDNTINGHVVFPKDDEYEISPNCILCEKVVKEVEKKILNKKSKDEIKDALIHACDRLKNLKNKCNAFIDKHGDQIVDLLLQELTPKEVCRELGYCIFKDPMDLLIDEAVRITVIAMPSEPQTMIEHTYTLPEKTVASPNVDLKDKQSCVLCEFVITQLEKELSDKKTQDEIEKAVKNVCKTMPKSITQQCDKFVDQYGSIVIQLIATSPPQEICTKLDMCQPPPKTETHAEVLDCAVCHASAQALAKVVDDTKAPLVVNHVIDKTCNQLPGNHYDQCSALMDIYGQSLVNIISRNELHTACAQIGKCFKDEYVSFVRIDGKQ